MFGNFIYFIIVILIYSTYQPPETAYFTFPESLMLWAGLFLAFVFVTRAGFRYILARFPKDGFAVSDQRFSQAITRQQIMAVVVFAFNIYGLGLPAYTSRWAVFSIIPTLEALLYLALFVGYLCVVWALAWEVHCRLSGEGISRWGYVGANISFSLPVLLPWVVLSGLADLIKALPFEAPRRFLATTQGEIAYFLVFLVLIALVGPVMIQRFWRCRPLESGEDRSRIEALFRRVGLGYREIMSWPIFGGRMITAGVMGLVRRFRYILVTRALLRYLEPKEIEAVMAHEIGHIKHYHLMYYLVFFMAYMVFSYATFDLVIYGVIYLDPLYRLATATGLDQSTVISAVFSGLIILMFLVYFRFIFGYFMRNFERQADVFVFFPVRHGPAPDFHLQQDHRHHRAVSGPPQLAPFQHLPAGGLS